jgi:hypothetical protein
MRVLGTTTVARAVIREELQRLAEHAEGRRVHDPGAARTRSMMWPPM